MLTLNLRDVFTVLLLSSGTFFLLVSAVGVWRFPDIFCRMHALGKASTLGIILTLSGTAVHFSSGDITIKTIVAIVFQLLTIPVSTHLMAKTAYRIGLFRWEGTHLDEYRGEGEPEDTPKGHVPPHE
jgi:multicomponent Na+:H+ antiporter subunit G